VKKVVLLAEDAIAAIVDPGATLAFVRYHTGSVFFLGQGSLLLAALGCERARSDDG
jgi:hypothetical protein